MTDKENARRVFRSWTATGVQFAAWHPNGVQKLRGDLENDIVDRFAAALQEERKATRERIVNALRETRENFISVNRALEIIDAAK